MNLLLDTVCSYGVTAGVMQLDGNNFYSIELPWLENEPDKSCVPAGTYQLLPYDSPTHGATWRLHNPALNVYGAAFVPEGGRSQIELHAANWARQLLGCIAFGFEDQPLLDPLTGLVEPAVENSVDAISEMTGILGPLSSGHTLTIERDISEVTSGR
jgi:hypothetical protein